METLGTDLKMFLKQSPANARSMVGSRLVDELIELWIDVLLSAR